MANFVVVIDPDSERRSRFIEIIKPLIPPVDGLVTTTCSTVDFSAIWASGACAPVSYTVDDQGAAVIWGEAISGTNLERMTATQLGERWGNLPDHLPDALDGFHAAVAYQPKLGLVVGADLLGLFPVYYYARREVLLVGSSLELFRYHPEFRLEFNPAGLVGMLLLMHIVDGQTLLREVRRLGAGNLLVWQAGQGVREVAQYRVPISTRYFDLSFQAHVDLLSEVLDETMRRRIVKDHKYTLLLSGGLDSRMLGGYLQRNGVEVEALTLGLSTDIDMQCAIGVARTLGLKHHTANVSAEQYPHCADLQAKWEHGANGFNTVTNWGVYSPLKKLDSYVVLGYVMDAIIGTSYLDWAYSHSTKTMTFDTFLKRINAYGIQLERLKKLLRSEVFGNLVDETVSCIHKVYQSYSEFEFQRVWCFNLYHRQRFHVGRAVWALSFGAWPVMPVVDARVIECMAGMPAATIADRRVEKEVLCQRFPQLASLPLARNASYNTEPLRPRIRHILIQSLLHGLRPVRRLNGIFGKRTVEQRYNYRLFDFNGPGWLAIRQQAEPYRGRVLHLFNKDVLAEILPPPPVSVQFKDEITEASGLKLLLGLMLWSKEYL